MNMKIFRALAELTKPVNQRSKELIGHITNELIAPGDNTMKSLMREVLPEKEEAPISLRLTPNDRERLKGLLCR